MVAAHGEAVVARDEMVGDIDGPCGAAHGVPAEGVPVDAQCGEGAYTFELQEISLAVLFVNGQLPLIDCRAVQVAVLHLTVAVVVVPVVGQRNVEVFSAASSCSVEQCSAPSLVEHRYSALALGLYVGEVQM